MKEKIEVELKKLIGLRLSRSTRAATMECFEFSNGDKSLVNPSIAVAIALHIQCPWRITNDTSILVGSDDVFHPVDETAEYDENFVWDIPGWNLRDHRMKRLVDLHDLLVIGRSAEKFGGFELAFENDIVLKVFTNSSKTDEYSEHWRIFNKNDSKSLHFVVTNSKM